MLDLEYYQNRIKEISNEMYLRMNNSVQELKRNISKLKGITDITILKNSIIHAMLKFDTRVFEHITIEVTHGSKIKDKINITCNTALGYVIKDLFVRILNELESYL